MQRLRDYISQKFHYSVSLVQNLADTGSAMFKCTKYNIAGYNRFLYNGNIMFVFSVTLQLFATLLKRIGKSLKIDFSQVWQN